MSESAFISIPARFNGPPNSGNGGYSCGVLAAHIEGIARVRLHSPPPLDRPLQLHPAENGSVELYDGDTLVGSAWSAELDLDIPAAPSLEQARNASEGYLGKEDHTYPTCFVCGPGRPHRDGLCLYPGPVSDWSLVACPWEPSPDLLDEDGTVREEIVWAALDCPGFYGAAGADLVPVLLGELVAELRAPVPGDQPLVVYAWPIGKEGRKYYGGVAIADESGAILACSHTTWIQLKN